MSSSHAGFRAGALILLTLGVLLVAAKVPTHSSKPVLGSAPLTHGLDGPFSDMNPLGPEGVRTTLDGALKMAPFAVALPNCAIGSDETVTAAWVRDGTLPEVVIHYESGMEAYISPWDGKQTPDEFYREQIKGGVPGSLESINGAPAVAVPSTSTGPPSVDLVTHGINVVLIDKTGALSLDDLLQAAETI